MPQSDFPQANTLKSLKSLSLSLSLSLSIYIYIYIYNIYIWVCPKVLSTVNIAGLVYLPEVFYVWEIIIYKSNYYLCGNLLT